MTAVCWVIRDVKGLPWDDEHDAHFNTANEAAERIKDITDERVADGEPEPDLHAAELDAPCLILTCSACGEEPEDDEWAHVHFPDVASLDAYAEMCDWRRVDGGWRCDDCPTIDGEDEDDEAARPGPNDVPLPLEVTR